MTLLYILPDLPLFCVLFVKPYFGKISSMEARIFMKFETYARKIVPDHQLNFHKDPRKDARARGVNACARIS